ncbi:MAG: 3-isopropylmalate dehydratase, partial [Planctomycetes bacterium]|nr:3-isopropylmalate dehydratase [Planctomycetota bacterium]
MPRGLKVEGRVLFLARDPELVRRQLQGEDLSWTAEGPGAFPLRDDISTDEITPATICYYYDETLGDFPYTGLRCGDQSPVGRGQVRAGGFAVSVSGKRRGKGSSREQAPYAEWCAGVRVVIAENIERIYAENCRNLGILTSTDFRLIDRIRRGETLSLDDFTQGLDPVSRDVVEFGGLYNYNRARLQGLVEPPPVRTPRRAMTLAERIIARRVVTDLAAGRVGVEAVRPGDGVFVRADLRFSHEYVTPMASIFFERLCGEDARVNDPASVLFFRDHLTFLDEAMSEENRARGLLEVASGLARRQEAFARRQGVRLHGEVPGLKGSEGICHSIVCERYARPGAVVIGSDSHTPHSGAVGSLAFGVGTTALFNSWITRDVRITVPSTVRVDLRGRLRAGVTAKDVMLELLRRPYVKEGRAIGAVVEYAGEAVAGLSIDDRATLTNMAAEVGAFTGIVAPDARTVDFLVSARGMGRGEAEALCRGLRGDPGAEVAHEVVIDASRLGPMVALPGDPGNGVPLEELGEVPIEIAYGGSCTAGKTADMDLYAAVLREGLARGLRVAPGVSFWIQYGSQAVKRYCEARGHVEVFQQAGARVIEPSCGACINAGPGVSTRPDQVTVSAINRNFPGRSGPGRMYLASPCTV